MNPGICKKCGSMECYVILDKFECDCGCKDTPKVIPMFFCKKCNSFPRPLLCYTYKDGLESFAIKDGKWTMVDRKKFWFGFFKGKYLDKRLEELNYPEGCPYCVEHEMYEMNRDEQKDL